MRALGSSARARAHLLLGIRRAPAGHQHQGIPVARVHVGGFQLNGPEQFFFRRGRVPLVKPLVESQRGMGFRQAGVGGDGLLGGGLRLAIGLRSVHPVILAQQIVGDGKLRIGARILGILRDRGSEAAQSILKSRPRSLRQGVEPLQVSVVRGGVDGGVLRACFRRARSATASAQRSRRGGFQIPESGRQSPSKLSAQR